MLHLATTAPEPAVDVTWCFYAREEIERAEQRPPRALGTTDPNSWPVTPPSSANRPTRWSRPDARARCGYASACAACGPTRRAPSPAATPSTAWRLCSNGWPAGRDGRWSSTGAPTQSSSRSWWSKGESRATWSPTRLRLVLNHRYAPDRDAAEAEAFLHHLLDPVLEPDAGDSWEVMDAGDGAPPSLDHPLLHALVLEQWRRAEGQGGLDRRGVVLGARRAGGQLRSGRPTAGPPPRRAGLAASPRAGEPGPARRHRLSGSAGTPSVEAPECRLRPRPVGSSLR